MTERQARTGRIAWAAIAIVSLTLGYLIATVQTRAYADPGSARIPGVDSSAIPVAAVGPAAPVAFTVYLDGSGGKKKSASKMNLLHKAMAAKGWSYAGLTVHEENDDLEGWWITYVAISAAQ